jgi:hypothetical protein
VALGDYVGSIGFLRENTNVEIAIVAQNISVVKRNSPRILVTMASEPAYRKKKGETKAPILNPELTSESALVACSCGAV